MVGKYEKLLFGVRRSVKYHDRRRRFFENVVNFSMFVGLIGGVAFIGLGVHAPDFDLAHAKAESASSVDWVRVIPGTITSLAMAIALLSKATVKANLHNRLKVEFIRLRQDMERKPRHTKELVAEWTAQRLAIEADEPPINGVVDALCHNELSYSLGKTKPGSYVRIRWWHRLLGPFTRSLDDDIEMYKEGDEKGPWMSLGSG